MAGAGTGVIKSRQAGLSGAGLYNADVQCFNCSLWPCAGLRTRQLIDWPGSRRLELQLQVVLVAQSQPEPRSTFPCSPFLVTTNQPLTKSLLNRTKRASIMNLFILSSSQIFCSCIKNISCIKIFFWPFHMSLRNFSGIHIVRVSVIDVFLDICKL